MSDDKSGLTIKVTKEERALITEISTYDRRSYLDEIIFLAQRRKDEIDVEIEAKKRAIQD